MQDYLRTDRGCDSDAILQETKEAEIETVIPPKKNREEQGQCDEYLNKLRPLVENSFLHLKRWRGIATRHAKNTHENADSLSL
jgi:hypothetical protein